MAYSYKSAISFGLVHIPVTLFLAAKDNDISFNLLDKKTKSRIKYVKTCVDCKGKQVKNEDIVKGYEYAEDNYVIFEQADFEKIKSPKDKIIDVISFFSADEIEPIYFNKCYYAAPDGATKAFNLFVCALAEQKKAALAKTVFSSKQTLLALRSVDGQLIVNTLFFYEEIQKNPAERATQPEKEQLKLAKMLIQSMSASLDMKQYTDGYREKLMQAIESKIVGKKLTTQKQEGGNYVADLMEALKLSLAEKTSSNQYQRT